VLGRYTTGALGDPALIASGMKTSGW
jgi:hypothetical protein